MVLTAPQPVLVIMSLSKGNALKRRSSYLIQWTSRQRWYNSKSWLSDKSIRLMYYCKCLVYDISQMISAHLNLILSYLIKRILVYWQLKLLFAKLQVRNQGSCGSCYAFASRGMLEARLNILTRNTRNISLSPQVKLHSLKQSLLFFYIILLS